MRLRLLPTLFLAALATAAPAAAAGPVFMVVSSSTSLEASRSELTQVQREQRRIDRALGRARALADSTSLLSDRLDAEKTIFQLEAAGGAAAGSATRLDRELAALEAAASAPVVAPAPVLQPTFGAIGLAPTGAVGDQAVAVAAQYLGIPYVWGGADPVIGFDCSGLVQFVYGQLGIPLSHYAAAQFIEGAPVPDGQLLPGDLVFFEPRADGPGHVGIYAGGDQFLEAPHSGAVVRVSSVSEAAARLGYMGAVRPYAAPVFAPSLGF